MHDDEEISQPPRRRSRSGPADDDVESWIRKIAAQERDRSRATEQRDESDRLMEYRVVQLETRCNRLEKFVLGVLALIGTAFLGGLFALLNLPKVPMPH
jgi:hypothetical protein